MTATATQTATPTATPTPPFGTLSVSGNLSFGKVKVNSTASKKLKVKNKGKGTLQVTIGTLDPPFTVTSGSGTFNLAKGKTEKVTVQFKPTATGPRHTTNPEHHQRRPQASVAQPDRVRLGKMISRATGLYQRIIACAAGGRGDPCTHRESEKRKVAR